MLTMPVKVVLAVAGAAILVCTGIGSVFVGFSGWLKWVLIVVGALMVMPLWDMFAGTPAPQEKSKKQVLGFEEFNAGDASQDWKGLNGRGDN